MGDELRSMEVTYFAHETEDLQKVEKAVRELLGVSASPDVEVLEGHFGNKIVRATHTLRGAEALRVFRKVVASMGEESRSELLESPEVGIDERMAMYIRLGKQDLVKGKAVVSPTDPVRIKVRPGREARRDPVGFYSRLIREGQ